MKKYGVWPDVPVTKDEKYKMVCHKILGSINKNRLEVDHYYYGILERIDSKPIDLYTPIFYKHNPEKLETLEPFTLTIIDDAGELFLATKAQASQYERVGIEKVSEYMLDEMLDVEDCGLIKTAVMESKSIWQLYDEHRQHIK